jgi:tetratricopeptide (TPR) repeat protein
MALKEIQTALYQTIRNLCDEGDASFAKNEFDNAINAYSKALTLIPVPLNQWNATVWLYVALAESYFQNSNYQSALENYLKIREIQHPKKSNPLVHLQLALCYYKTGNRVQTEAELNEALVPYGIEELDEPVYWKLIKGVTIRDGSKVPRN